MVATGTAVFNCKITVHDLIMCHCNYVSKFKFVKSEFLFMRQSHLKLDQPTLIMHHNQHVVGHSQRARLVLASLSLRWP